MSLSLPPHHQKSLDSTQCSGCLQTDDRDDMPVTYDGRDVCWLCVSVGFLFCTKCGLLFDKGIMFEPEGSDIECICPDCMKIITGMTLPKHQLALPARREYRKKTRNEIIADLNAQLAERQLEIKPYRLGDLAEFLPRRYANQCIIQIINHGRHCSSVMVMPWDHAELPDILEIVKHINFNVVEILALLRKSGDYLEHWRILANNEAALYEAEFTADFPDLVKVSKDLPPKDVLELYPVDPNAPF